MAEQTITDFLNRLAGREPTPGGGGAAALMGALSAALASMVANLTTGKKKYAFCQEDIERLLDAAGKAVFRLYEYIEADAEAFEPLAKAYGIPKGEPGREELLENALKEAAQVPLSLTEELSALIPVLEELLEKGSRLAVSDVAVAAAALRAAMESAVMNVYINTGMMKDRERAEAMNRRALRLAREGEERLGAVYGRVREETLKDDGIQLLKGLPVARAMLGRLQGQIQGLKEKGILPCLAVVRIGQREDDLSYERGVVKRFEGAGAAVLGIILSEAAAQEELESVIRKLNEDRKVHGVLLLRPLPPGLKEEPIKRLLSPAKDVDGMTRESDAHVFAGDGQGQAPCTPQAVMELLSYYGIDLAGKKAVIVGRSLVVGRPLAMLMLQKNATVTICHTKTGNLKEECRRADILVACAGAPRMITADYVREGQIVIDVGIHAQGDKLCGDVDAAALTLAAGPDPAGKGKPAQETGGRPPRIAALTPVPGGVGSVTTAVLLKHVVENAARTS